MFNGRVFSSLRGVSVGDRGGDGDGGDGGGEASRFRRVCMVTQVVLLLFIDEGILMSDRAAAAVADDDVDAPRLTCAFKNMIFEPITHHCTLCIEYV